MSLRETISKNVTMGKCYSKFECKLYLSMSWYMNISMCISFPTSSSENKNMNVCVSISMNKSVERMYETV